MVVYMRYLRRFLMTRLLQRILTRQYFARFPTAFKNSKIVIYFFCFRHIEQLKTWMKFISGLLNCPSTGQSVHSLDGLLVKSFYGLSVHYLPDYV